MNLTDKIERLRQKKLALEREIADAEAVEKRLHEVVALVQKSGIGILPDAVLLPAFAKILAENPPKSAQNTPTVATKPAQNSPAPGPKPSEKGGPAA